VDLDFRLSITILLGLNWTLGPNPIQPFQLENVIPRRIVVLNETIITEKRNAEARISGTGRIRNGYPPHKFTIPSFSAQSLFLGEKNQVEEHDEEEEEEEKIKKVKKPPWFQ